MHLDPWILNILIVASVRILFFEFELNQRMQFKSKSSQAYSELKYNKYRKNLLVSMIWVFFMTMTRVVKKHLHKVFFFYRH